MSEPNARPVARRAESLAAFQHFPRNYRFSDSKLLGDSIQCGYHGMVFNAQGRCTKMTGAGAVPHVMRVRTYPVVEKRVRADEELVVRREATERTERIADTVKKTKVRDPKTK